MDLTRVDHNLQALKAIESSWSTLPPIPDEVKLDLAGNSIVTPAALGVLFTGLSADLEEAERPQALPTRDTFGIEEPVNPSYGYQPQAPAARTVASLVGLPQPQVYDVAAPQRLKQQLADRNYLALSPEEIASPRWLPEYSYAARQLNFDNMSSQFRGNKPGSLSIESILGFVDEWLSPRGLYRAAVELDLWWDAGQISKEYQEWDDKLAAWRDDPWNLRNFVDLLGPVDDILFPALNIGLLFTGIGEVIAVGRGVHLGLKGAQATAGLYRGAKGLRFAEAAAEGVGRSALRAADDIARFAEPSFLSRKAAGIGMETTSNAMNLWRSRTGVIIAKKANQQVMRAGFASNVEQLIDADRGGMSLDRFTGIGETVNQAMSNPMVDWGVDLLFTPANIWNPGTFSRPGQALVEGATRGFLKAANNETLISSFHRPIRTHLEETQGIQAAKDFDKLVGKRGLKGAISDTFYGGDDEKMGFALSYVASMAGIESHARRVADAMAGDPIHELASGTRTLYHHARDVDIARLRQLDPNNVEDLFIHITKYGDLGDAMRFGQRRADKFYQNYRRVRGSYLESAETAAARGGAVPDDHVRFYGTFNREVGRYEWSLNRGDADDPFFLDLHRAELEEFNPEILTGAAPLPDQFANRYIRHDAAGHLRHNKLSEAANVRLLDPEKLADLKGLAARHNNLRNDYMREIMDELTGDTLEQYVYEVLPRLGKWDDFIESSGLVRDADLVGDLRNATFVSPMSDANRKLSAIPWSPGQEKWSSELFKTLVELPGDEQLSGSLMKSIFAPFARHVDPQMGSFTVATLDTVTKQQALGFAATATRSVRMVKAIRKIKAMPHHEEIIRAAQEYADEVDTVRKVGLREALAERIGGMAISEDRLTDLAAISRVADEAGISLDEVETLLLKRLSDIDALPDWAEKYRVTSQASGDDIVKMVDDKIRELKAQSYFMASEVEGVPQALVDTLRARNYRLVYGVEFASPLDMGGIMPAMADMSKRQLHQRSLGDFFSRQDPDAVTALKVRKVRDSLHARLAKIPSDEGVKLNLGSGPDIENADLNRVVDDLHSILREQQDLASNKLQDLRDARLVEKIGTRASLARIPFSLDRLASDMGYNKFIRAVTDRGYSAAQAQGMYHALQSSQALGFRRHGLFAIESKLRSSSNLADSLRFFGTVQDSTKLRRTVRGAVGSAVGVQAANYAASEAGLEGDAQLLAAGGGLVAGGVLAATGLPGLRGLADAVDNSRFASWSYLADHLANYRDMLRFSLSPIFDASRYSEAIILSQIGEMPPGLKNLRVNQSPSAWRKSHAKELVRGGMNPVNARQAAETAWARNLDEFAAAARGYRDFEWEVIDGVGRRFSSVGILGFSPADWMASTYAHMRAGGVDAKKAYDAVREIYTYGTTGRSAAELSMNFVFFPFSFTKKTVGHLSKFFTDDLTRLIVLQDLMATYQALDERYELSSEWRDRLPVLEKAHRLNILAYGIGLGQFGGVNNPMIERLPLIGGAYEDGKEAIVNAFMPQMVPMANEADAESAWDTVRTLAPVFNDVNTMMGMMVDQGYVLGSESHLTRQAEQRRAWDEWREFQVTTAEQLTKAGISWGSAMRDEHIGPYLQAHKTMISLKYPSWKMGLGDGIAHQAAIDMELKERLLNPTSPGDRFLAEFHTRVEATEAAFGATFDGSPEELDPALFDLLRRIAIDYAKQEPEFARLYNRFYRRSLGDIVTDA